jgi:hypothetical protein
VPNFREKICKLSGVVWKQYNSFSKCQCEQCKAVQKKPQPKQKKVYRIPKVSKKRKVEMLKYSVLRTEFLAKKENSICFIEGCNKPATTIEHRAGRGINYLNVETWAGCCLEHNLELENNPELSKKYQLSKIHKGKKL